MGEAKTESTRGEMLGRIYEICRARLRLIGEIHGCGGVRIKNNVFPYLISQMNGICGKHTATGTHSYG